ncbi:MAG: dihydroorotase family protein [Gammaproteobacteria bacterium]|nr:dihydroorotase family protein [Gammaproteobacteria bacterium]
MSLDLVIKNVRVVRPDGDGSEDLDIGIHDGKIARLEANISPDDANAVHDGEGRLLFPGLVDGHMHVGIYSPLADDAVTESKAAAMGGVTSAITYFRTGQYYLNKGGSYEDFYPEVLQISNGNYWVDYAYHLAPISSSHIDEMESLLTNHGVCSFKIFMFYGGYGLHGKTDKDAQKQFLMIGEDESYDIAHFEFIMRSAQKLMKKYPQMADQISVSLHCELADILNAYTKLVQKEGKLSGLRAYSAARPPHSEGLAIWIASYLAYETDCVNINLLHLTSRKAVEAALMMQKVFPHINFRREVTIGHMLLDYDAPAACHAKVNPPIRSREDVEFLWEKLLEGEIDWVVSDHACCSEELKTDNQNPKDDDNIWVSKSGFGGTEYLLSGLFSEGSRRGMTVNHMARLVSKNPAERYGLLNKGDIKVGYDADLVLLDPDESFVVRAAESESSQGYTPFEGMELTGRVKSTFLRGQLVYDNGDVVGSAQGQYLSRPSQRPA